MTRKTKLDEARRAKADEFYTLRETVQDELKHYKKHFAGRVVFCNCDDPQGSEFWKYFYSNFKQLGLKKLLAVRYNRKATKSKQPALAFNKKEVRQLAKGETRAFVYEYNGKNKKDEDGNCPPDKETPLKGDGDFASKECEALLAQADIVVTNPPFSLFRDYIKQLVDAKKKFLVIGNINAIATNSVFAALADNKMWLGAGKMGMRFMTRKNTTGRDAPKRKWEGVVDGKVVSFNAYLIPVSTAVWFTNLPHKKRNETLDLVEEYTPKKYPKYDNYDAIEVSRTVNIPLDYNGEMGVPITFLCRHNPAQFEIVPQPAPNGSAGKVLGGKQLYGRILIKRRK